MYARWPPRSCSPSFEEMSGDLRRDEAGQLRPLPLDGSDQLRVRDRDRRLVGERLDELDLLVGESSRNVAADHDCPDQVLVQNDRNTEQSAVADDDLGSVRVVGVGEDIGDLHRLTGERHPADDRRPIARVRMFHGVLVGRTEVAALREDHKEIAFGHVELSVLAVTEPPRGLNDFIEHGLQSFRPRDRSENLADSPSLFAQVLVIPNELLNVEWLALLHAADFTTNRVWGWTRTLVWAASRPRPLQ
jgi:hypothetical protein